MSADACVLPEGFPVFSSSRDGSFQQVQVALRPEVSSGACQDLAERLLSVPWNSLEHAYGPASDVPVLLFAATLGTDSVRSHAWWELWGSIHHQGSVYPATVPAVTFLVGIAGMPGHPDRVQALSFLRQVSLGEGDSAPLVRSRVEDFLTGLLQGSASQPELLQRALLLFASAFPEHASSLTHLTRLLPRELSPAWEDLLRVGGNPFLLVSQECTQEETDQVMDAQDALETWALAGWEESL